MSILAFLIGYRVSGNRVNNSWCLVSDASDNEVMALGSHMLFLNRFCPVEGRSYLGGSFDVD